MIYSGTLAKTKRCPYEVIEIDQDFVLEFKALLSTKKLA